MYWRSSRGTSTKILRTEMIPSTSAAEMVAANKNNIM
jgi:hypothetical protein